MKIAFVNNQCQLGGAETVMEQLRAGVQKAGHLQWLHVAEGKTYPPEVQPLYPRCLSRWSHSRLHRVVERFWPRATWTDRSFRSLTTSPADLIHLHNFHGQYATLDSLAHVAAGKNLVWTFHAFWGITGGCDHPQDCTRYRQTCGQCPQVGRWPIGPTDDTAAQWQKKLALLSDKPLQIVAPSQHLARKVSESPIGRCWQVHPIPNGVDAAQFGFVRKHDPQFRATLGLNPKATTILVVNRNFKDPQKGYAMVLKALSMIDPSSVEVVLAGQNSDWATAQLPAALSRVDAGYVRSREAMATWFEAADLFLFASAAENFPCVILEAMAAKCCVVATPTSGVTEQIEDGVSGLLAGEIFGKSLGLALRDALADSEQRRACGEMARQRVEREFSEQKMVARHLDLYERIIRQVP